MYTHTHINKFEIFELEDERLNPKPTPESAILSPRDCDRDRDRDRVRDRDRAPEDTEFWEGGDEGVALNLVERIRACL